MGLFDKKFCDVCGEKIGLLGNRKLSDGNLCKDCAAKLSPWFSERKQSTVDEIKAQLDYREANKNDVAAFKATRMLGDGPKVYIDEAARKFMVVRTGNPSSENPDVINISDITDVRLDIHDSKSELKRRDSQNNLVSYVPPQYEYTYTFYVIINVNHPYFDEIKIQPTKSVRIAPSQNELQRMAHGGSIGSAAVGALINAAAGMNNGPLQRPEYVNAETRCKDIVNTLMNLRNGGASATDMAYGQVNMQQTSYDQPQQQNAYGMNQNMGVGMMGATAAGAYGQQAQPQMQGAYGQPQMQQNAYGQPQMQQNAYGQPAQPQMQQNAYGQPQQMGGYAQAPAQPQVQGPWFCPNCGTQNEGKFCINCGTPRG